MFAESYGLIWLSLLSICFQILDLSNTLLIFSCACKPWRALLKHLLLLQMDTVISQAQATLGALVFQRSTFGGINSKLSNVSSRLPTVWKQAHIMSMYLSIGCFYPSTNWWSGSQPHGKWIVFIWIYVARETTCYLVLKLSQDVQIFVIKEAAIPPSFDIWLF